ncbi:MAG: DUF6134 family protein [Rhodospirillales bacterium]|nr:DUF6134 family protein [Rhodospirillales bacterium]
MIVLDQMRRLHLVGVLIGAAAVAGVVLAGPLRAALPGAEQIVFEVFRNGAPLGHHKVVFRREAGDLHVEIDIRLEVKLFFIAVFQYRHRNHEVWRDGRLVAIDTETDDDGEAFWLSGRATEDGLAIEGSSGSFLAPADVMPTSYWNPQTVERARLLDTQRGRLIEVAIAQADIEEIEVAGRPVDARRYKVTGDLTLDLWYTASGEWAKTSFQARGAEVVYARQGEPAALAEIEASANDR